MNQWQLQEEALMDIYRIDGIDQIEIYYDIEKTKALDPVITAVALSAITLVITKISEHLIKDIYESLKEKIHKVLRLRKHAAKLAMDITFAIKIENSFVVINGKVKNDSEIDSFIRNVKTTCTELHKGYPIYEETISTKELNNQLLKLAKLVKH